MLRGTLGVLALSHTSRESVSASGTASLVAGVGFGTVVKMATDGNGGQNPISAARNQRERVDVANDFDDVD